MDSSLEDFFSDDQEEPFFVKNLENVQGDERDCHLPEHRLWTGRERAQWRCDSVP